MIILAHNYWKISICNYAFSIYYWIYSFIYENKNTFVWFAAGPACFAYEQGVMSMSTRVMAVRMHNAGETLTDGNCYHFSQGGGIGRWLGVFKELKRLSSERMETSCSFSPQGTKENGIV